MEFSFSDIIKSIKDVIVNPKEFWISRKEKDESQPKLMWAYFLPILFTVAIAVFIGEFLKRTDFFIEYPALKTLKTIVMFFLQYFISVFFTNELIKTFGGEKNKKIARKLVVYSITPLLLVSIITGIFPFLYVIDILGIYCFYIFGLGAKELLVFPENKLNSYILITILVNFFIFSFLSIFLSKLLTSYY